MISTTGLLVVLLFWQFGSRGFNPLILPSPRETFWALQDLAASGKLLENLFITLYRTLLGYSAAIFIGLFLAILLNSSKLCDYFFRPLITVIQVTPPVIWLVLAIIWFGIAENITPIFLIFIVTLPVIFINIYAGLEGIEKSLLEMASVYRFSKRQVITDIYLPSLVTHLVSAVSIGLAIAWKAAVFAEFFGSSSGIGFALSMANNNLETDKLFAWALVLIGLMLVFEYLVIQPMQKFVIRWKL